MAQTYNAIPQSSHAPATVALSAATRKTVIQVATPSTTDLKVIFWGISFDGVSATAVPVLVDLTEVDVAATVTSLTPTKDHDPNAPASLCVGGTSATGYNASAEGSIGSSRIFEAHLIPPTSGGMLQLPLSREHGVAPSKFLRFRVLAPAAVNCMPVLAWEE